MRARILLLCAALLLGGCATVPERTDVPRTAELLDDALFKAPAETIETDSLFALSPEMRSYLQSPGFRLLLESEGTDRGLVKALYDPANLQLRYDTTATRSASGTFGKRAGNCLSLVIMTAAFAKQLGLSTHYQQVMIDETWTRSGQLYMSNTHVNLVLAPSSARMAAFDSTQRQLIVDFLPGDEVAAFRVRPVSEDMIEAMFMNNRAAEALSENRLDDAYGWARALVRAHPTYIVGINTLGVIYERKHELQLAERAFRMALEREPSNLITMYNLLSVLRAGGREEEAKLLAARVTAIREVAPFAYFERGMEAMRKGDFQSAQDMFRREVERAPYYDEFHYWLGVASYRLGDTTLARKELELAVKNSTTPETKYEYSAKLNHIRSMRGSDQ